MNKGFSNNLKRPITKRDVLVAIVVIILGGGPYVLREIYPENMIIQNLFGGLRLFIYWTAFGFLCWRFDKWMTNRIQKKNK